MFSSNCYESIMEIKLVAEKSITYDGHYGTTDNVTIKFDNYDILKEMLSNYVKELQNKLDNLEKEE